MDDSGARELIHQVNNLLGAIQVQVAVARAAGTEEAARAALEIIERAATKTEAKVRQVSGRGEDAASDG